MPFQTYNPRQSDEWTIERIALLLKLDAEGRLSRAQIANELAIQTGSRFSRNAILGKLTRLGAPKKDRPSNNLRNMRVDRPRAMKAERPQRPAPSLPLASLRLSLMDLEPNHCRFITSSHDTPAEFCGHPVHDRSYCAGHYQICYVPVREPRPDQAHRIRVANARRWRAHLLKPKCEAA